MQSAARSQPERSPAEIYDERFVPALFAQWGGRVAAAANLSPGQRVLDVGCGTGVLALAAAARVGPNGYVAGVDPNAEMLAVARRKSSRVEWSHAFAESLPFADASFDAVISQFALMFFEDRRSGVAKMWRMLRRDGWLAVAVWDALEHTPGYRALTDLLQSLFGVTIADAMRPPFSLGNPVALKELFADAGVPHARVTTHAGTVRFDSIDAMISTERACVWTLGGLLNDAQFELLRKEAGSVLRPFVGANGAVTFDCPAHIVTAIKL